MSAHKRGNGGDNRHQNYRDEWIDKSFFQCRSADTGHLCDLSVLVCKTPFSVYIENTVYRYFAHLSDQIKVQERQKNK